MRALDRIAILMTVLASAEVAGGQQPSTRVLTCETISLARPGYGVAYRGEAKNGDYRFTATIPTGLTGWGAAPVAPFHGFAGRLENVADDAFVTAYGRF